MNLTIEIPEDEALALKAKAQAEGVSPEEYAVRVLAEDLSPKGQRSIAGLFQENMRSVPPEELAKIPSDAATEHDHYIYGTPKKHR